MITLTAKINLLSGDNTALSLGSNNLSGNNISSDVGAIVGVKKQGSNPFILGASKLGDDSTFSDGVDYFIGEVELNKLTVHNSGRVLMRNGGLVNETTMYKSGSVIVPNMTLDEYENSVIEFMGKAPYTFGDEYGTEWYSISGARYNSEENSMHLNLDIYVTQFSPYLEVGAGIIYFLRPLGYPTITIENTSTDEGKNKITSLTIAFDTVNNRHPNKIFIDGKEYIDDDAIFTVSDLEPLSSHTIVIDNWNSPNYPLVITGIYAEVSIEIDRRNLISISRSIFDRSDLKLPSWGIISNAGNIEFTDLDGEIRDYAEQLLLESGLKCEIFLNNTLANAQEKIGLFETDEWDYDNDNRVVSVSLKDDLEEWQDINVAEISYDPRNPEHNPFKWLYEKLWAITTANNNYDMLSFDKLDESTQDILSNTYIQYPLLESGSLWQQWTKLCEVCQLHIYKDNNGVVVCSYNGGN